MVLKYERKSSEVQNLLGTRRVSTEVEILGDLDLTKDLSVDHLRTGDVSARSSKRWNGCSSKAVANETVIH